MSKRIKVTLDTEEARIVVYALRTFARMMNVPEMDPAGREYGKDMAALADDIQRMSNRVKEVV